MRKKQINILVIVGIGLLVVGIVTTQRPGIPDVVKGILMGIAIGLLALPLIAKKMGKVSG